MDMLIENSAPFTSVPIGQQLAAIMASAQVNSGGREFGYTKIM